MRSRVPKFLDFAMAHPEYPSQLEEQMSREQDEKQREELRSNLGDILVLDEALPTIHLRLADITFENELTFHGTKRDVKLLSYGGGHTHSDAFLYLMDDNVAFLGDLISVDNHNQFRDGDIHEWITILEKIEQLPLTTVIAGHGPIGDAAHVNIMRTYFTEILSRTEEMFHDGFSIENITQLLIPEQYESWSARSLYFRNVRQVLLERYEHGQKGLHHA